MVSSTQSELVRILFTYRKGFEQEDLFQLCSVFTCVSTLLMKFLKYLFVTFPTEQSFLGKEVIYK